MMPMNNVPPLEQMVTRFRSACEVLKSSDDLLDKDAKFLEQFHETFEEIAKFAPKLDVLNVPANGHRSLLRTLLNIAEYSALNNLATIFVEVLKDMKLKIDYEKKSRQIDLELDLGLKERYDRKAELYWEVEHRLHDYDVGSLIARHYLGLNHNLLTRLLIKTMAYLYGAYHATGFTKTIKCLGHYKTAIKSFNRLQHKGTALDHHNVINHLLSDNPVLRILRKATSFFLHSPFQIAIKSSNVRAYRNWQIRRDGNTISINPARSQITTVSFVSLRSTSKFESGKVLIHLCGGAFLGPSVEAYVDVYLREFASKLPGVTVIGVKFPVGPEVAFPEALQAILDFYLWLTSGHDDVTEQLGFHPKEIVISGDSSGKNLASSLLVALNEIKIKMTIGDNINGRQIQFPKSMVSIFPGSSLISELNLGLALSYFDGVLRAATLHTANDNYVPLLNQDANRNWIKDRSPILLRPYNSNHESVLRHPLISSHLYDKFEDLSTIKLTMIVLNFCPLIDTGLQLAKSWKGPVKLVALDDVFHPFLGIGIFNWEAQAATNLLIGEFEETFK